MKGLERFDIVYPATTNGFLLLILSLIQPDTPFNIFEIAVVTPAINPKIKTVPPIERINKGNILWIISEETSVKKETSPIMKTGTDTPNIIFSTVKFDPGWRIADEVFEVLEEHM